VARASANAAAALTCRAPGAHLPRAQSNDGHIDVSVKDAAGAAAPGAEVTLMVVDRATLDLLPYGLQVSERQHPACVRVVCVVWRAARRAVAQLPRCAARRQLR
jgi:hypothetical protein